jgi:2-haloacid dehalogenase
MHNKTVIAFDLMGTLLDVSALDKRFEAEFDQAQLRREWFSEVLKLALAITAAGGYESFSEITQAALKVIEVRYQHELSPSRRIRILEGLRELPAFPDVAAGFEQLKSAGYKLIVLTNSRAEAARAALESAGLFNLLDNALSAEQVTRLKPAPEPYRMAAREVGVEPNEMLLVAAHSWDVAGAKRAGCRAAFVRRPQQVLDELTPKPDYVVLDLLELALQLNR